VRVSKSEVNNA